MVVKAMQQECARAQRLTAAADQTSADEFEQHDTLLSFSCDLLLTWRNVNVWQETLKKVKHAGIKKHNI